MRLSYVIISYNRCNTLRKTLDLLPGRTPLADEQWDVWVVDNASTDSTGAMMKSDFAGVNYIRLTKNQGMPARNHAFDRAQGKYIICLDDDSYPSSASTVSRMLAYMDEHPETGALVARVELPDGSVEGPAFPSVVLGGATCFRASALHEVGGFAPEFFRQAEEYELSCRLWGAGYRVERFEDVVFRHDKVNGAGRASSVVHRMDTRNNLIVADRFLPKLLRKVYREDWSMRYGALARKSHQEWHARRGRMEAAWWGVKHTLRGRQIMSASALENVFQFRKQADAVASWSARNKVKRVAIADFSKNLFATFNAARLAELEIVAIADDTLAYRGLRYRGVQIAPPDAIPPEAIDGVILSNINPAQIDSRMDTIRRRFSGPVLRLWQPQYLDREVERPIALAA